MSKGKGKKAGTNPDNGEFVHEGNDRSLVTRAIKFYSIEANDAGYEKLQEVLDEFKAPDDFPWRNRKTFDRRMKRMADRRAAKAKD